MYKKRRKKSMEETKKELKEEIEERVFEEKNNEELKVRDYTDIAKELTGVVKENSLTGFQICLSIWEGNLKLVTSHIEQWVEVQEGYANLMRDLFENCPDEAFNVWGCNSKLVSTSIEKLISFQKE